MKRKSKKKDTSSAYTQVVCDSVEDVERWKKILAETGWTGFEVTEVHKWVIRGKAKRCIDE